jgi:23S rRNA pseudouridine1911/1915/1917 synthase
MTHEFLELNSGNAPRKERIDVFLVSRLPDFSRSQIQRLIKTQNVTVDGQAIKPNYLIRPNQHISVAVPPPQKSDISPENIPLDIVYEDEFLILLNKPAGVVVHPAAGNFSGTLVNALLHHCKNLSGIGGVQRPGVVHRLDKNTSGLIVFAKDDLTHRGLSTQFSQRTIEREYRALIWGHPEPPAGKIQTYLRRNPKDRLRIQVTSEKSAKLAITNYEVLERFDLFSLVKFNLETGRTHQIRVHANFIGHPVFGDPIYGGRKKRIPELNKPEQQFIIFLLKLVPYQALHALTIGFQHPITNEYLRFESELPAKMTLLLDHVRRATV